MSGLHQTVQTEQWQRSLVVHTSVKFHVWTKAGRSLVLFFHCFCKSTDKFELNYFFMFVLVSFSMSLLLQHCFYALLMIRHKMFGSGCHRNNWKCPHVSLKETWSFETKTPQKWLEMIPIHVKNVRRWSPLKQFFNLHKQSDCGRLSGCNNSTTIRSTSWWESQLLSI